MKFWCWYKNELRELSETKQIVFRNSQKAAFPLWLFDGLTSQGMQRGVLCENWQSYFQKNLCDKIPTLYQFWYFRISNQTLGVIFWFMAPNLRFKTPINAIQGLTTCPVRIFCPKNYCRKDILTILQRKEKLIASIHVRSAMLIQDRNLTKYLY